MQGQPLSPSMFGGRADIPQHMEMARGSPGNDADIASLLRQVLANQVQIMEQQKRTEAQQRAFESQQNTKDFLFAQVLQQQHNNQQMSTHAAAEHVISHLQRSSMNSVEWSQPSMVATSTKLVEPPGPLLPTAKVRCEPLFLKHH